MSQRVDCVVVGAGVVGLAVARCLAQAGREVWVLEAQSQFGTGVSARSSEVIHAGLYYSPGSLKARLCRSGAQMLYRYCAERGIAHNRCGKMIVACSSEQLGRLDAIQTRARANGVVDLRALSLSQALALEPNLQCLGALLSPSTGIIDSQALMSSLLLDLENAGGHLALNAPVTALKCMPGGRRSGIAVHVGDESCPEDQYVLIATSVINAAGLQATSLAANTTGLDPALVPTLHACKGNYFTLAGRAPFSRLIYPVPEPGGLGVHLTLDLGAGARFGPDVQWNCDPGDLSVDPLRVMAFESKVRKYWPQLPMGALQPGYAAFRPRIFGPGQAEADFVIQDQRVHAIAGLVNLFGIESPGLTSCLALAQEVRERL